MYSCILTRKGLLDVKIKAKCQYNFNRHVKFYCLVGKASNPVCARKLKCQYLQSLLTTQTSSEATPSQVDTLVVNKYFSMQSSCWLSLPVSSLQFLKAIL